MKTQIVASALLALALAPAALAQNSITVQAGVPAGLPGFFPDIPEAVAFAQPGDLIIVNYVSFDTVYTATTIDKPLTIAGRAEVEVFGLGIGDMPYVLGGFRIENVDGDQPVRLWRMSMSGANGSTPGLAVEDCSAPIVLEGLEIANGLRIDGCEQVVITDCDTRSVDVLDSTVFAYQSEIDGAYLGATAAGSIGAGVRQDGGRLFLSGSSVRGGNGSAASVEGGPCTPGIDGGALFERRDSELIGGSGGSAEGGCPGGVDGSPIENVSGTVVSLPGSAPTVATYETIWNFGFQAFTAPASEPGDLVFTIYSPSLQPLELADNAGLLLAANPVIKFRGVTDDEGFSIVSFPVPLLPPGSDGIVLEIQYAHINPNSLQLLLGPPISAIWF